MQQFYKRALVALMLGVRVVRARMLHQSASAPETAKAVIGLATIWP